MEVKGIVGLRGRENSREGLIFEREELKRGRSLVGDPLRGTQVLLPALSVGKEVIPLLLLETVRS